MSCDGGETSGYQKQKLDTVECVGSSLSEISRLANVINNPQQTKLIHQRLPNKMRRRAMSYNPKRLPKKYQTMHIQQMKKSGVQKAKKTPSRKYRRKASNLKVEYTRRQNKYKWLETHIWHAKRFHMKAMWDKFKIPYTSCDNQYRASHRAVASHCFIQDISYMAAIEIVAPLKFIIKKLRPMLRAPKPGYETSITASAFTTSGREGFTEFYHQDTCPLFCIGRVSFFWRPTTDPAGNRSLWLYTHPSFHEELLVELIYLFNLKNEIEGESEDMQVDNEDDVSEPEDGDKVEAFNTLHRGIKLRNAVYVNKETGATITDLKHTLNRFRLTGPYSHATLQKVLKCVNAVEQSEPASWFTKWYNANGEHRVAHIGQQNYWNRLGIISSPANLSPNMTLALNVEDPRLNKASKKMKALPEEVPPIENDLRDCLIKTPKLINVSGFWDKKIRDEINKSMVTTHAINKIHEVEGVVPAERCKSEDHVQPIPILLIQRPGNRVDDFEPFGYGTGWDIIVPEGYGLAIWTCLINWGAKAGGLQETQMWDRELATNLYAPDTVAASKDDDTYYQEQIEEFFAKPLNKRQNYFVLGVNSPFRSVWDTLVEEWFFTEGSSLGPKPKFFVMRDPVALEKFKDSVLRKRIIPPLNVPQNALIPVYLIFEVGGPFTRNSMICLPTGVDYKSYRERPRGSALPKIVEPMHADKYKKERKETRRKHLQSLRKLRSRRVRERKRLEAKTAAGLESKSEANSESNTEMNSESNTEMNSESNTEMNSESNTEVAEANAEAKVEVKTNTNSGAKYKRTSTLPEEKCDKEYEEKMRGLWIPAYSNSNDVNAKTSRKLIGFITKSFFSPSMGKTIAFGYVPTSALLTLVEFKTDGPVVVLARDINSHNYYYATLRVMSVN